MRFFLPFILAASLYAEATFDQVQSMINNHQYKQAVLALTLIDTNHPNSSKVQYTLAQAHAGLGNLSTAQEHFLRAKSLNPKLDFVPSDAVASLEQAITPQTKLIKPVSSGPSWWEYLLVILSFGLLFWIWKLRSKPAPVKPVVDTPTPKPTYSAPAEAHTYSPRPSYTQPQVVPTPTATHTEHHYYHSSDSGISTLGTVAIAAGTAAAVSSMMDDDRSTHSYQPESISSSWDEPTPRSITSSSWNDTSARSTTWDDDTSSSRNSSWSDSSSSSSSWDSSSDYSSSSSSD